MTVDVGALPDVVAHVDRVADRLASWPEASSCYRTWVTASLHGQLHRLPDGAVHLLTGDIPAMWLRDSAAQLRGLWSVVEHQPDGEYASIVAGVIRRHVQCLAHDAYANSFTDGGPSPYRFDRPRPVPPVWERKWEVDSVAYSLDLWARWWRATGDGTPLAEGARDVAASVLDLLDVEQDPEARSTYSFRRPAASLPRRGKGPPVVRCGLVRSAFRPSDDRCRHGFLVPSNAHLVVGLRGLAGVAGEAWRDGDLAERAAGLASAVDDAIVRHAVADDGVLAYEIDGAGARLFMDEANVPSLLSLPYLGWRGADDEIVAATRAAVLSPRNPWWIDAGGLRGLGSPHTGRGRIWPMAIAVEGLSAPAPDVAREALERLVALAALLPEGRLVESVRATRPDRITRRWFGWPNALAAELCERVAADL